MKTVILLVCIVCNTLAAPDASTEPIPILRYDNEGVDHEGTYSWAYETGNEIVASEKGYVRNIGVEGQETQVAEGSYSYTGPDGVVYTVTYIADENGFQPRGAHLPTPPPIPKDIEKSIEYIKSLPPNPEPQPSNVHQQYYKPRGRF